MIGHWWAGFFFFQPQTVKDSECISGPTNIVHLFASSNGEGKKVWACLLVCTLVQKTEQNPILVLGGPTAQGPWLGLQGVIQRLSNTRRWFPVWLLSTLVGLTGISCVAWQEKALSLVHAKPGDPDVFLVALVGPASTPQVFRCHNSCRSEYLLLYFFNF